MTTPRLAAAIEAEEGRRLHAYPDPLTGSAPWTIGVGHTGPGIREGLVWTDDLVTQVRDADIAKCVAELDHFEPWWRGLSDERQDVLVQMTFQLGIQGEAAFKGMIGCLRAGDWQGAASHMRASKWDRQTPERVGRLARIMETGEYPS